MRKCMSSLEAHGLVDENAKLASIGYPGPHNRLWHTRA